MLFEFSSEKSHINKVKHGINFIEAQELWKDRTIEGLAEFRDEKRHKVMGKIDRVFWTAIITYRGNAKRIISVRRSHENEKALYERLTKKDKAE